MKVGTGHSDNPSVLGSRLWRWRDNVSALSVMLVVAFAGGIYLLAGGFAQNQSGPTPVGNPTYINPNQILPPPQTSFYNQPWRGYMETIPATTLVNGVSVVYSLPSYLSNAQQEKDIQYMASVGIKSARIAVDWNNVAPTTENQLAAQPAAKHATTLALFKKYGITPLILLNANDGAPEPSFAPAYK